VLVFSARLPLKHTVTTEDCMKLILEWIAQNPKYSMSHIPFDSNYSVDYEYKKGNTILTVSHCLEQNAEVLKCRIQKRNGIVTWYTDFFIFQEQGTHYIHIHATRDCPLTSEKPYRIIKPSIIRTLIDRGYCLDDHQIPITDTPLDGDKTYYRACVNMMNGQYPCDMPAVYVSCDNLGNHVLNYQYLSAQLGGMAHVFVQKDPSVIAQLEADTQGRNVSAGDVAVYYPWEKNQLIYSVASFADDRTMNWKIINDIRGKLTERIPLSR